MPSVGYVRCVLDMFTYVKATKSFLSSIWLFLGLYLYFRISLSHPSFDGVVGQHVRQSCSRDLMMHRVFDMRSLGIHTDFFLVLACTRKKFVRLLRKCISKPLGINRSLLQDCGETWVQILVEAFFFRWVRFMIFSSSGTWGLKYFFFLLRVCNLELWLFWVSAFIYLLKHRWCVEKSTTQYSWSRS